jgi:Uma2 family endonuclease
VVQTRLESELNPDLPLKRWTVEEYHRMITAGILTADDRVELLEGQIIEIVPQDPPHASVTDETTDELKALLRGRAKVRSQFPITLAPNSEPEPDIAVVRIDERRYYDRHPNPDDIYLLIEVADSTLSKDRNRKAKVYAKANILEYWILDVNERQVFVFREPQGEIYQSEQILTAAASLSPVAFPEITIEFQKLFP